MNSYNADIDDSTEGTDEAEWILAVRSDNEGYREYVLKQGQNNIGREGDNDIVLLDNAASSYHAKIHYDQESDTVAIQDNKSTNGTYVNSNRIHKIQALHYGDTIRVGLCLITMNHSKSKFLPTKSNTFVTDELIIESIDHYGVLLHDIGQRLVNMPDLDIALTEISELVKRTIGAEKCQIILAPEFEFLNEMDIPVSIAQKTIENKTASIFLHRNESPHRKRDGITLPAQALLPMLMVPVLIDEEVIALIFAKRSGEILSHFHNSDLKLVLAISDQVAMSIQRSRVEKELIYNSKHDSLTHLPNRAFFLERLTRSIARSKQGDGFEFAMLFFDIDNFKVVNDSLGHVIGDNLLLAMAERLKHNIRNIDIGTRNSVIARFGGDEFAILLGDVKESRFAVVTANRLKEILARPFNIDGKQIFSTASVGIALSTTGYEQPDEVIRDADMAMYQAKAFGKDQVQVYDASMRARAIKLMNMGTALRKGAIQREFRLHYQPIISLETQRIVGHEALLRWYTADRGILNPGDFMKTIDTTELINTTDHWVLQNACSQAAVWQNQFPSSPPLYISVNLSPENIKHPNLISNVHQVLQETKLDPSSLWLEITEKTIAPDDESSIEVLNKLRSLGIRISLDDFGTGYSALNYLAQFPVDGLKIDRSFVKMIGIKEPSSTIIEMVKALAKHLGIIVVAEGVEEIEQLEFLKSINCEYAQGFFYSKPLDAKSATELLSKGPQW